MIELINLDYDLCREVLNVRGSVEDFLNDKRRGLTNAVNIRTNICISCINRGEKTKTSCGNCENRERRNKLLEKITELDKFIGSYVEYL